MYHWFVKQHVRKIFEALNRQDYAFVLAEFAPHAEHWFSGGHALSGGRHSAELREAWYRRLAAVLPGLRFEIRKLIVTGPPWNTHVTVEWRDRVFDLKGDEIEPNQGVFLMTIRWARAVEFHVYCDTEGLSRNLRRIAEQGLGDAVAAPIADAVG